jgi:sigma-E factor negative regulatory protein RseC
MIETRVRVVSARGGLAWVEATESGGCSACQSKSSCGISGLGRFLSNRRKPVAVSCGVDARPGQELTLAVEEGDLLRAGLLAYLLPAILAVLGAFLGEHFWHGDAASALAALAGVVLGLAFARLSSRDAGLRARSSNSSSPISLAQGETP